MSTATLSRTDAAVQRRKLLDEIDVLEMEIEDKAKQVRDRVAEFHNLFGDQPTNGQAAPAAPAPVARGGGKGKGHTPAARPAPAHAASDNRLKGSNQMSLRRAIWHVLDRNPSAWNKILPDVPARAEGLTIAEVREIIEKEKLWTGENIGGQLGSHLYTLKKDGLIERSGDGRYFIVEGADIDAPKGKGKKKKGK